MPTQIGIVKEAKGSVIAVDNTGAQRVLRSGDVVFEGETVKTVTLSSKAIINMNDSKEVTILGNDSLSLNEKNLTDTFSQGGEVADVEALQKALLNGKDIQNLEETAAGGAANAGGEGVSLGSVNFLQGGHTSNVNSNYNNIDALNSNNYNPSVLDSGSVLPSVGITADDSITPDTNDNDAPVVTIESVTSIDNSNPSDNTADSGRVIGKAVDGPNSDPLIKGSKVEITNSKGEKIGEGVVEDGGKFDITTTKPINPNEAITVKVTDPAGNEGTKTKEASGLTHTNDNDAPNLSLTEVNDNVAANSTTLKP